MVINENLMWKLQAKDCVLLPYITDASIEQLHGHITVWYLCMSSLLLYHSEVSVSTSSETPVSQCNEYLIDLNSWRGHNEVYNVIIFVPSMSCVVSLQTSLGQFADESWSHTHARTCTHRHTHKHKNMHYP